MSEWLQSLGKATITAGDISDTNYAEFERLEYDNVKAINKANDEFAKGVEKESQAAIQAFMVMHTNKGKRLEQIKDITKSGMEVAKFSAKWLEAKQEYDEAYDTYTGSTPHDKVLEAYNDGEKIILQGAEAGEILAESDAAKENLSIEDRYKMTSVNEQYTELVKNKRDAKKLGGEYYDLWRESTFTMKIPVPDGQGGYKMMSLSEANMNTQDWNYIDKALDRLFLMNVLEKGGFNKGFVRKYITYPMMQKAEIRAKEQRASLSKALQTEALNNQNDALFQSVETARTSSAQGTTITEDRIRVIHDKNGGKLNWQASRNQVFSTYMAGVENDQLSKEDVIFIGNEWITPFGGGKKVQVKNHWEKEYNALLAKANEKETTRANNTTQNLAANQALLVSNLTNAVSEAESLTAALPLIRAAKKEWDEKWGLIPYPAQLQKYINIAESPIDWDTLESKLEYHQENLIPIPDDLIWQIKDPTQKKKWLQIQSLIIPAGWETQPRSVARTIAEKEYLNRPLEGDELTNLQLKADELFLDGYSASMSSTIGIQGITTKERMARARKAGNDNVTTGMHDLLKQNKDYFAEMHLATPKDIALTIGTSNLASEVIKNPGSITNENLIGSWEEPLIQLGEQYLRGELGDYPPVEWQQIARYSNLNAHDLITARLEALGRIPKGVKVDYSNENGKIGQYKTQSGMTYRILNSAKDGDNTHLEFAEAIDKLQVNKDVDGYDHVTSKGKTIETEKPLSQMTLGEVLQIGLTFDDNGAITGYKDVRLGMYNLSGRDLLNVAMLLNRNDSNGTYTNRVFDQDLQDELIFLKLRADLDHHKTLNGATSQQWSQTLNLPIDIVKELQDVYPQLTSTPYLQIQHLLPDVAKALLVELSGTQ